MLSFEKLIVWQKAIDYAVILVQIANTLPNNYQYSFSDQLRRSALSIPSNIAEGAGRKSSKVQSNFYSISRGSVYESVNILKLLERLKSNPKGIILEEVYTKAEEICRMPYGLSK